MAQRLRRYGVVIAAVSLDGLDAATHDHVRGQQGAFEAALPGMRALRRAGILLHVSVAAIEHNIEQTGALMALIDELGAGILLRYQLVPVGRGEQLDGAALDREMNARLVRSIADAQRGSGAIIEPVAAPQYWPMLLQRAHVNKGALLRLAEWVRS